ncbi:unnamed protein product [Caenorhabditis angaria]|uniref:Uncharacterized protein n=1 Tax=Caenorhabditis angaria TaxID=860376 RepID=A0A9P1MYU8_9PELO|nr:unnamed protein product [Caenorhabditis angaria]
MIFILVLILPHFIFGVREFNERDARFIAVTLIENSRFTFIPTKEEFAQVYAFPYLKIEGNSTRSVDQETFYNETSAIVEIILKFLKPLELEVDKTRTLIARHFETRKAYANAENDQRAHINELYNDRMGKVEDFRFTDGWDFEFSYSKTERNVSSYLVYGVAHFNGSFYLKSQTYKTSVE